MTREEAIEIVRKSWPISRNIDLRKALETLIPELQESENEKIRKFICSIIDNLEPKDFVDVKKMNVLAYLEKQKEQKPAEWKPQSESLEALRYAIEGKWEMIKPTSYLSRRLEDLYEELINNFNVDETLIADKDIEELEAMKAETDALMKEEPAEWSEEDEEKMNSISEIIEHCVIIPYSGGKLTVSKEYKKELQCFLKSLRPAWKPSEQEKGALRTAIYVLTEEKCFHSIAQLKNILNAFEGKEPRKDWKPSEEQMDALADATMRDTFPTVNKALLESLYEQLKKL